MIPTIQATLTTMHGYLSNLGVPYNSMSVMHSPTDGFIVVFSKGVKDLITDRVKKYLAEEGFNYSFIEMS